MPPLASLIPLRKINYSGVVARNNPAFGVIMNVSVEFVRSQISDIDAKLSDLEKAKKALLNMRKAAEEAFKSDMNGHTNGNGGHATGFREAVRRALQNRPQGLTPIEIIKDMRTSGDLSKYTGKTNPTIRIHNELYALRKKGEVVKSDKKYRIKEARS